MTDNPETVTDNFESDKKTALFAARFTLDKSGYQD
jgi:hypothetical protein